MWITLHNVTNWFWFCAPLVTSSVMFCLATCLKTTGKIYVRYRFYDSVIEKNLLRIIKIRFLTIRFDASYTVRKWVTFSYNDDRGWVENPISGCH